MRVPMREHAIITLTNVSGFGGGTAQIGPLSAREVWYPSLVSVSVSTPIVNESQASVYAGDQALAQYFIDSCIDGSSGDSTGKIEGRVIKSGQKVFAVWTGGDIGKIATMVVTGEKEI